MASIDLLFRADELLALFFEPFVAIDPQLPNDEIELPINRKST